MTIEYVIWGCPEGEEHEQVLHTLSKDMTEAKKISKILETDYKCSKLRVQILNLNAKPDFISAILA
jgi:hypothetical protein